MREMARFIGNALGGARSSGHAVNPVEVRNALLEAGADLFQYDGWTETNDFVEWVIAGMKEME